MTTPSQVIEELKSEFTRWQQVQGQRIRDLEAYRNKPGAAMESRSIGERFIESPEIKGFQVRLGNYAGVSFAEPLLDRKTTITSGTVGSSTPGILVPERVGGYIHAPYRRIRVRDVIPFGTTTNNSVEYVKRNSFTNAASPISEGSAKPESALTFTISSAPVRTIAHFIPASVQVLQDLPQLQSIIDLEMLEGLADIEDHELLRGDNTDQHLNGIITQATAFAGTYSAAGDTRIDQVSAAMMELEAANYVPDALIVNPVDWRRMLKVKTEDGGANTGAYIMGGPGSTAAAALWNIRVVPTTAMVAGTFLVGQFQGNVQGFDRVQATISIATEHSDWFTKNLLCVRAEERITVAVYQGGAFRYGAFA